jgi:hypothetical protein
MEQNPKRPKNNNVERGKEQLKKLLRNVNDTVPPLPSIDVHEELSRSRETPKGHALKVATYTSTALLLGTAFYAMITHDRELILALVHIAVALLAGAALGKKVPDWLGRKKRDDTDEEDK